MSSPKLIRGHLLCNRDPVSLRSVPEACVHVEDGVIRGILTGAEGRRLAEQGVPMEDYGDRLLIPGLTDLHVHAPQYVFRGTGMDLELLDWLEAYTFPEESRYGELTYAETAYTLFADALRDGPTTRACVFATTHVPATLRLMELLEERGLGAFVGKVSMDRDCPDALRESAEEGLRAVRDWLSAREDGGLVRPILTPRFVPTCSADLLAGLGKIQREFALPVQSHLSENPAEVALVKELCPEAETYGHAYAAHGLFGGERCPTIMAHCVYSEPKDHGPLRLFRAERGGPYGRAGGLRGPLSPVQHEPGLGNRPGAGLFGAWDPCGVGHRCGGRPQPVHVPGGDRRDPGLKAPLAPGG